MIEMVVKYTKRCAVAILFLGFFLSSAGVFAQAKLPEGAVAKETFLYTVKKDSLYLDRYELKGAQENRPCILFVFGGGFRAGTRDNKGYKDYFEFLANKGYVVVSIDYRLTLKGLKAKKPEEVVMPLIKAIQAAVEDLYDATKYVVDHAPEWKVDPSRVIVSGSSAGAITALQAEYGNCNKTSLATGHLPENFHYAGVIAFAGAILENGKELSWAEKPAPTLLFHGDCDASVPYDQIVMPPLGFYGSKAIAGKLHEMDAPYVFYHFPGAGHEMSSEPMHDNLSEIGLFIESLVINRKPLMMDIQSEMIGKPKKDKPAGIIDFLKSNF